MLSRIRVSSISAVMFLMLCAVVPVVGQSTDVRFPTAVDSNEVLGAISARDIGDARLTDHFYTFNGFPGDLLITIDSKNLNGDFDVFTASELRPVLKIVVYADNSSPVTKNVFLRKNESLILRVEARTPNDDEGTYKIHFGGTFAPIARSAANNAKSPMEPTATASSSRKTTRVNSAGARIEEPVTEVAAAPAEKPTPEPVEQPVPTVTKTTSTRSTGTRKSTPRATTSKPTTPSRTTSEKTEAANTETTSAAPTSKAPAKTSGTSKKTKSTAPTADVAATEPATTTTVPKPVTTARTSRSTPRPSKPAPTAENGQLRIDVKGGRHIEYSMINVARVTIENGEVVIVTNDGHEERVPLTNVLRMSIGP